MANKARVQALLTITKNNSVTYQSQPPAFTADVTDGKGPSPGAITVPTSGKLIYFTELTTPSLCRFMNLEPLGGNYVEVGIYDPQSNVFYPLLELWPQETYIVRLTRNFGEQYAGSGTGTTGPENYMRLKANGASVDVLVEAFNL